MGGNGPVFNVGGRLVAANACGAQVLHAEPTILLVELVVSRTPMRLLAAHAPPEHQRRRAKAWWSKLFRVVERFASPDVPLAFGIDAHGRLGGVSHPYSGGLDPDAQDNNGAQLLSLLRVTQTYLPQTFPEVHHGPSWT